MPALTDIKTGSLCDRLRTEYDSGPFNLIWIMPTEGYIVAVIMVSGRYIESRYICFSLSVDGFGII